MMNEVSTTVYTDTFVYRCSCKEYAISPRKLRNSVTLICPKCGMIFKLRNYPKSKRIENIINSILKSLNEHKTLLSAEDWVKKERNSFNYGGAYKEILEAIWTEYKAWKFERS